MLGQIFRFFQILDEAQEAAHFVHQYARCDDDGGGLGDLMARYGVFYVFGLSNDQVRHNELNVHSPQDFVSLVFA